MLLTPILEHSIANYIYESGAIRSMTGKGIEVLDIFFIMAQLTTIFHEKVFLDILLAGHNGQRPLYLGERG